MWPFTRSPVVPVLRFSGPIGMATPLRPGLSISTAASAIEKAFSASKLPTVAIIINSPGGSPVQSSLIAKRVRQLAEEKGKRVYTFCEDVAASGGYWLALGGDEIYADTSSIIGSIGVISSGFGFDRAMDKLGIDRRVYTSGTSKSILDPFKPEKAEDIERIKTLQSDIHDNFISMVKERRLGKLKGLDSELFSGAFWSAATALEHGLAWAGLCVCLLGWATLPAWLAVPRYRPTAPVYHPTIKRLRYGTVGLSMCLVCSFVGGLLAVASMLGAGPAPLNGLSLGCCALTLVGWCVAEQRALRRARAQARAMPKAVENNYSINWTAISDSSNRRGSGSV